MRCTNTTETLSAVAKALISVQQHQEDEDEVCYSDDDVNTSDDDVTTSDDEDKSTTTTDETEDDKSEVSLPLFAASTRTRYKSSFNYDAQHSERCVDSTPVVLVEEESTRTSKLLSAAAKTLANIAQDIDDGNSSNGDEESTFGDEDSPKDYLKAYINEHGVDCVNIMLEEKKVGISPGGSKQRRVIPAGYPPVRNLEETTASTSDQTSADAPETRVTPNFQALLKQQSSSFDTSTSCWGNRNSLALKNERSLRLLAKRSFIGTRTFILLFLLAGTLFALCLVQLPRNDMATPPSASIQIFTTREELIHALDSSYAVTNYSYIRIDKWDVSRISNFSGIFSTLRNPVFATFNDNIGDWDVSGATDMAGMFAGAALFNQDLNHWVVSKVTNMDRMFYKASTFNGGGTEKWDVAKVRNFASCFHGASTFNTDISSWNTSSAHTTAYMFRAARSFNQDLRNWDVSHVATMEGMFMRARIFNGDISRWETGKVENMRLMFSGANRFNINLYGWNVTSVRDTGSMFLNATSFNQGLCEWGLALNEHTLSVDSMFTGSSCQSSSDPILRHLSPGPMCHICTTPLPERQRETESSAPSLPPIKTPVFAASMPTRPPSPPSGDTT